MENECLLSADIALRRDPQSCSPWELHLLELLQIQSKLKDSSSCLQEQLCSGSRENEPPMEGGASFHPLPVGEWGWGRMRQAGQRGVSSYYIPSLLLPLQLLHPLEDIILKIYFISQLHYGTTKSWESNLRTDYLLTYFIWSNYMLIFIETSLMHTNLMLQSHLNT